MTYNLPEFNNELQSEHHFIQLFSILCRLNDGLLGRAEAEIHAMAVAELDRSVPPSDQW